MKQRFSALFLRIAGFMVGLILLKTGNKKLTGSPEIMIL